jgi:A/G-specific adenine glycosylase
MTVTEKLLNWYQTNQRELPWRTTTGGVVNPYHVWLSEIMLQQTTVATVKPYFKKFILRWPTIEDLASAELDEILVQWQGLGYYARARNMHQCAAVVVADYGGHFPQDLKMLKKLPGIGEYTAAAILSIAFQKQATVIDGNVERVMSRLYAIETPLPQSKQEIKNYAEALTPEKKPGDYAQAVMDLGATVCTPTSPRCLLCPLTEECKGYKTGKPEGFPVKLPKAKRPVKTGIVFWIENVDNGAVLLRKRPLKGLLAGMMEIPSTEWKVDTLNEVEALSEAPIITEWINTDKQINHTFTHFSLILKIYKGIVKSKTALPAHCLWCKKEKFDHYAIPTVMKKVIRIMQ